MVIFSNVFFFFQISLGPPGTGKTTLCKAIAQKMAIRMNSSFKKALLIEVNSHSLFSKWFSEVSGLQILFLFFYLYQILERQAHPEIVCAD